MTTVYICAYTLYVKLSHGRIKNQSIIPKYLPIISDGDCRAVNAYNINLFSIINSYTL